MAEDEGKKVMGGSYKTILMGGLLGLVLLAAMVVKEVPEESVIQRAEEEGHTHLHGSGHGLLTEGTAAPGFRLATANGTNLRLEDLKGSHAALIFVTPTCPYCQDLKALLLDRDLPRTDRLVFITPAEADPGQLTAGQRALEAKVTATFPVLSDSARAVARAYGANSVPTVYLLDEEGKIAGAGVGVDEVMKRVEELLEKSS